MVGAEGEVSAFGGYVIDEEVGRGGSATVYRAHHVDDPGLPVALKILDEQHHDPDARERLAREFEFAHNLDHPHIQRVYRRGSNWLAMQFIDGGHSTDLTEMKDQLTALVQIGDALDYIHRCGIVHSDVKPSNILVGSDFASTGAVLIDFGVAHAVVEDVGRHQDDPLVSLPYTAPEVLAGRPPSAASDLYAFACTTVELLTGRPPFSMTNAADLVNAHLYRNPPPIAEAFGWANRSLDVVLGRALKKMPEERYRSCTEFIERVVHALRRLN